MNNIRKIMHHPLLAVFLIDIIIVCILGVTLALIGETILPGIIYRYVSPLTLFAFLFALCSAAALVAHTQNISYTTANRNIFLTICAFIFFIALVGIASLRYGIAIAGMMVVFASVLFFAFYKIYREELRS